MTTSAAVDHAVRHVAVQVERRHDRHIRADDVANHAEDRAVRVAVLGGDHGAVVADVDTVERHRRLQPRPHLRQGFLEECVVDRAACLDEADQDGNGLPLDAAVHGGVETQHLRRETRFRPVELGAELVAGNVEPLQKVIAPGDRGEAVALQHEAKQGDALFPLRWEHRVARDLL